MSTSFQFARAICLVAKTSMIDNLPNVGCDLKSSENRELLEAFYMAADELYKHGEYALAYDALNSIARFTKSKSQLNIKTVLRLAEIVATAVKENKPRIMNNLPPLESLLFDMALHARDRSANSEVGQALLSSCDVCLDKLGRRTKPKKILYDLNTTLDRIVEGWGDDNHIFRRPLEKTIAKLEKALVAK